MQHKSHQKQNTFQLDEGDRITTQLTQGAIMDCFTVTVNFVGHELALCGSD